MFHPQIIQEVRKRARDPDFQSEADSYFTAPLDAPVSITSAPSNRTNPGSRRRTRPGEGLARPDYVLPGHPAASAEIFSRAKVTAEWDSA
ncbi:hypothetical protein KM043_012658 [Ampulex compressa]|nr:hypothetical protein KM043_012658 [Ampulex compressa]